MIDGLEPLAVEPEDFDVAADLVGGDRAGAHRARSSIDCPIAAIAERHEARLLQADGDFVHIASPCRRSMRRCASRSGCRTRRRTSL